MSRFPKIAAALGMIGPALFGGVLIALTVLQYDFMRSLGWNPLTAPTLDWPSGLALGRYGFVMTATFLAGGLLMAIFALGMRQALHAIPAGRAASMLMVLAGVALACLAFPTDPTIRSTPATLAGRIHDLAFVALGFTLFPAMLVFGYAFREESQWHDLSRYTWLVAALAIPSYALKGAAFYLFLAAILLWSEGVAFRLWQIA